MAARFGCADCPTFAAETIEEFTDHAKANHPGAFLSRLYRVERRPNHRPEIYLAHCSRCAVEIRSTTPDPSPVPRCAACKEILGGPLESQPSPSDDAAVNPIRSDPKETRMNRTEIIAALKAANVPGRFQIMNTPALEVILNNTRLAAAQEAIDVTPPAADLEITSDTDGDLAPPPATDKIEAIVNKGERIPADVATFVCRNCGKTLPVKKFPTVTGPHDRATTCRPCRDGDKGSRPAKAAKAPRAPKTPKAPAGPKGLDPVTAPFGIGGPDAATIDRTYKAAWAVNADGNGVVLPATADKLRDAHKAAHEAIVVRRTTKKAA